MLIISFFLTLPYRASSATLNGTTYRKDIVTVGNVNDEEPVFHQITDILEIPTEEALFVTRFFRRLCAIVGTTMPLKYN